MNNSDIAVRVSDVSKRFVIRREKSLKERLVNLGRSRKEDFFALSHVSLDINVGSTVGLIGPNGSGKSTLLKTIGGIIQPTTGSVLHRGRVVALLELGAGFHPDLTGRENVYLNAAILGISKAKTDSSFDEIVEFAGIGQFIDTQVKFYSSGMYVRLAFAVAVNVDPDILIVDEVLAVGDEPFQRKCLDRIRDLQHDGKTIVLVTQSLDQVAEFCDRAVVLEAGRVVFDGEPGPAIQRLRKDFEEVRLRIADDAFEVVESEEVCSISGVTVRSFGLDEIVDAIRSADGLRLEVALFTPEPIDGWVVGIGIESSTGQSVFATDSKLLGSSVPPLWGHAVYRFDLLSLPLSQGQYFVTASLRTIEKGELFRISQAASFFVAEESSNGGLVSIEVHGQLETPKP